MENLVPNFEKLERLFGKQNYHVDARILNGCNFDCIYCSDDLKRKTNVQYVSAEFLHEFAKFVFDTCNKKLILNLTGGEPLLHPEFAKIVQTPHVEHLSICTNFSINVHLLREYNQYINTIIISLHKPYWKKWQSIFKKISYFELDPKKIKLTIMYWPGDAKTVEEIQLFHKQNPTLLREFSVRRIRTKNQWQEHERYSEFDMNFMIKNVETNNSFHNAMVTYASGETKLLNVNELMTKCLWNFKGWSCGSLHEGCLLLPGNLIQNGNCAQMIMTFDDFKQFIKSNKHITCKKNRCFCVFDLKFTKIKNH